MTKKIEAEKLIDAIKNKFGIRTNRAISDLIFPNDEKKSKTFCNTISKLKTAIDPKIIERLANKIIEDINFYNKQHKNVNVEDLYYFLDKKVKEDTAQKHEDIEGVYLMFRKSNVGIETKEILVSYLDIKYENDCLYFSTERNNLEKKVHVKTNGIGVKNISDSYLFIGLSSSSDTGYSRSFVETLTLRKFSYDINPIVGYWSGFVSLNSTDTPFVGSVVLIKITNSESIKRIKQETLNSNSENSLGYYQNNTIIKLHGKESIEEKLNPINNIIKNENVDTYNIKNIISNLEHKVGLYATKYEK